MNKNQIKKALDALTACNLTYPIAGVATDSGGMKPIMDPLDLLDLLEAEYERITGDE